MQITLTPEFERQLAAKVEAGRFADIEEAARTALERLLADEAERDRQIAELNAMIQAGIDQLDRGESMDGEIAVKEIIEGLRARRR
jgi:antitoxin ParD1/3/4